MVDYDSKNVCVYQCNEDKLEAAHGLLLSLQNWLVGVVNPTMVGRGGEGASNRSPASSYNTNGSTFEIYPWCFMAFNNF